MELSIIVTAYNVAPFIEECLDSLLHQGLKDYEIIVVNDSSSDLTQPIIDRYVANNAHIHSVITPGIGLGPARDYGLKFSKSDYFVFIDGDDYMQRGGLGAMLKKIKKGNDDIVMCNIQYLEDDGQESHDRSRTKKVTGDIKRNLILNDDRVIAKIYRRSFWEENELAFPTLLYEELPVTLKTTVLANRIDIIEEAYYVDRNRDDNIMTASGNTKLSYIFPILEDIYSFFNTNGLLAKYHDELEYFYIERLLIEGSNYLKGNEAYHDFMAQATGMMRQYFPKYHKNKYINKLLTKQERSLLRHHNPIKGLWHKRSRQ